MEQVIVRRESRTPLKLWPPPQPPFLGARKQRSSQPLLLLQEQTSPLGEGEGAELNQF